MNQLATGSTQYGGLLPEFRELERVVNLSIEQGVFK
jgi:hypothetical protein